VFFLAHEIHVGIWKHSICNLFHKPGLRLRAVPGSTPIMALLCGKVDKNLIQMIGRWQSGAMIRYLHMQAQTIVQHVATKICNSGTYSWHMGVTLGPMCLPRGTQRSQDH
jgi:hypothetical protein